MDFKTNRPGDTPGITGQLRHLFQLLVIVTLVGCGGGGGGSSSNSATTGEEPEQGVSVDGPKDDGTAGSEGSGGEVDGGGTETPVTEPEPEPEVPLADPKVVTFASGLENPWGLAFLPDGSMLITERPGRLRHLSADGKTLSGALSGVPTIVPQGQGGLFDVALDPDFKDNRRVYLSFAERDATGAGTAVARGVLSEDNKSLTKVSVIFRQLPKILDRDFHFGGRLAFDKDGLLFLTLGEMGDYEGAQSTANHHGKVVRLTRDGKAAKGNPFADDDDAAPEVWSLGHRNPQGAAIHPDTGELWTVEHGPQGGDELNVTRAGLNYGWMRISHGCDYGTPPDTCTPMGGASKAPGLRQPLSYWTPAIAPSGMAFYTGKKFPEWKGNLLVGALKDQSVWLLTLDGNKVSKREALFKADLNDRIRDVRQGPDGWLYLLTDNAAGRVLRIER